MQMAPQFNLRLSIAFVATIVMFLGSASAAGAATQSVSADSLTATVTYHGVTPRTKNMHLQIWRNGHLVYNSTVSSKWCGTECDPGIIAGAKKVVHIVRLSPGAAPSVVLDLYSGGAHCCSVEQVYTIAPNETTVTKYEHDFGDPGVQLAKIGSEGTVDFLSADDAFAYAFTDYAASGMPIQILSFSDGTFHNVTRSFPDRITRDAKQWMKAFTSAAPSHYQDTVGVVAAWAADEEMLGHAGEVARFLSAQGAAGHLNSAFSPVTSSGEKYVVALQSFLRRHGYTR